MAFKLQEPGTTRRITLPGTPTQQMLDSDWSVLDVLGNPWGSVGHDQDDLAAANASAEKKIRAAKGTKLERDHQMPAMFAPKGA